MEIPYQQLSKEALEGVIKEFVLREGTDYGPRQFTIEEKIAHVRAQLERGKATVVFNPEDETCNIVECPR